MKFQNLHWTAYRFGSVLFLRAGEIWLFFIYVKYFIFWVFNSNNMFTLFLISILINLKTQRSWSSSLDSFWFKSFWFKTFLGRNVTILTLLTETIFWNEKEKIQPFMLNSGSIPSNSNISATGGRIGFSKHIIIIPHSHWIYYNYV